MQPALEKTLSIQDPLLRALYVHFILNYECIMRREIQEAVQMVVQVAGGPHMHEPACMCT